MSYIEFKNIVKKFGQNEVLKKINLSIEKGDFVTLLGKSGCGKSTLLRCLSGLEDLTQGQIILNGKDITELPIQKREVGMVFQNYALFPHMNVEENIGFGLKMMKIKKNVIQHEVQRMIQLVELEGKEKSYPNKLSGGQRQRVALARALILKPQVLLLDEPFSALDAKLRKSLQLTIKEIHKELNLTTLFVTHDQDEAMFMSDIIHLFNNGKIEQSATPIDLYTKPKSLFTAGFIGNYNQIDAEKFNLLTGSHYQKEMIVIRPETMSLSKVLEKDSQSYQLQGQIFSHSNHGNIIRYRVKVKDILFKVDVLFRSFHMFEDGESVYLTIPKHDCLEIGETL